MPDTTPSATQRLRAIVEWTEPQRVHDRYRASPHREDVAQDATDTGRRTLIRLDGRRVVVALDADGGGDAVTDVHDAGVLARSDEHTFSSGGQAA